MTAQGGNVALLFSGWRQGGVTDPLNAGVIGRVTLKQETDTDVQAGVLIFAPVYAAGTLLTLALAFVTLVLTRSHLRIRVALEEAGRANQALAERTRELADSEGRVRAKLEALLSPEGELETLELADIVDGPAIQRIMDDFFQLTSLPTALLDLKGQVLVATGWQEICT